MTLSVITDEISQDFEYALDVMLEYGVRAAELRGLWGANIAELTPAQTDHAKRGLSERGMVVSCLATPFYKCDLGEEAAAVAGQMHLARARGHGEQMALLERCCGLAHAFGTPLIRVFTFWRRGDLTPEIEGRIVDAFEEPVRIAEREGVTLVLENEHACYIGTGAETARVVRAIGSPHVRVCWDPGNALAAGERPFPDGYAAVRGLVDHVHVKDATVQPDGSPRWCVVGDGEVGYTGHVEALRGDGYTGYVSLETHYVPEGGTPEDGSRACLAALRALAD
ncbi:MAG TPA: sugar phosphate isomerase/epimerase family protein [Chthonomonadales bacterium]|nr:sugar phosphate isomerase/epimerase family protein [Chthonomonadales bacterium]